MGQDRIPGLTDGKDEEGEDPDHLPEAQSPDHHGLRRHRVRLLLGRRRRCLGKKRGKTTRIRWVRMAKFPKRLQEVMREREMVEWLVSPRSFGNVGFFRNGSRRSRRIFFQPFLGSLLSPLFQWILRIEIEVDEGLNEKIPGKIPGKFPLFTFPMNFNGSTSSGSWIQ